MQGAGAAETHQGEIPRVVALLHRHQAQGAEHGFVDDFDDALGGFHQSYVHGVGDLLHRRRRRFFVDGHGSAQLRVRGEIAQRHIRVAHGRLRAAFHVGGRPRHGAGGLGAYPQGAGQFGDKGDGAAASAHAANIHRRRPHAHIAHNGLASYPGLAVLDQGHIRGGASHVESQQVLVAGPAAKIQGAGDAAGRPGHEHVHRRLSRRSPGRQPPV